MCFNLNRFKSIWTNVLPGSFKEVEEVDDSDE